MLSDLATAPDKPSPASKYEAAKLRWASLADLPALLNLYTASRDAQTGAQEMHAWLDHGGSLVLQSVEGDLLCALRWRETEEGWEVDRIATRPEARGQGYGRWLMTKLEARAIRSNIPTLSLTLTAPEADLLAYYGRMGYQVTEQEGARVALKKRVGGVWQYKGRP